MELKPLSHDPFLEAEAELEKVDYTSKGDKNPCQKWDADSQSFVVDEDYQTDLIGTEDVAKLLDMNIDRVRYLSRLGRLPSIVLSSKSRVFSRKQLLQLEKPY